MVKPTKRAFSAFLALIITLSVIVFTPTSINAATNYEWESYTSNSNSKFSVSPQTGTFIIENIDFAESGFKRRVDIEKAGIYEFSAEVKIENFQMQPNSWEGSKLGIGNINDWYTSRGESGQNSLKNNEWTQLSATFTATNNDSIELNLFLGVGKGKATFRNIKLEKMDIVSSTTEWNALAVFYDKLDVTIQQTGKSTQYIRKNAGKDDINFNKRALKSLPDVFAKITGGRATIKNIDIIDMNTPLTKLYGDEYIQTNYDADYHTGVSFNPNDVLDDIISKLESKQYDEVLIYYPAAFQEDGLFMYAGDSLYLNGVKTYFSFYTMNEFEVTGYENWTESGWTDEEQYCLLISHEILHNVEAREHNELGKPYRVGSNTITWLHSSEALGYRANNDLKWLRDFAQNLLPNKDGLPAEAFIAHRYKTVNIPLGNITFSNTNIINLDPKAEPEPLRTPQTATPTASKVLVNSKDTAFDAYLIEGNNYFKLRDLAYVLSGTRKQFDVT